MRTGLPTLRKIALKMCSLILKFEIVIRKLYPTNTALLAALEAAAAACHTLRVEIEEVLPVGD